MFKKLIIIFIVLFIFVGAIGRSPLQHAFAAVEPGSEQDPVVTKSYLESFYKWKPVTLKQGQALSLDASVELIVLEGAVEVIGAQAGGLIDLTAGVELKHLDILPVNHLIMSPKSDGRGIKALKDSEIMARGMR